MLGPWAGYALLGLYFNYHISSHDYYSLPLIPIAALSIAPLADSFFARFSAFTVKRFTRALAFCVLLLGLFAHTWNLRADLKSTDYRPEAQMWAAISEELGDQKVAGLTQDYGQSLAYWGWRTLTSWPTSGDLTYHNDLRGAQSDFEKQFQELAASKDLFLVTDFDDLKRQPMLAGKLTSNYLVIAEDEGYVIFDLHSTVP
jgi:hypothetical protein